MPTRTEKLKLGWIGTGRMGYEMAGRLARGGCDIAVWNRTKAKAEPLSKYGAKVVDDLSELAARDVVFCMVSTWDDVKQVMNTLLQKNNSKDSGVLAISLEGSALARNVAKKKIRTWRSGGGNAKVSKAGSDLRRIRDEAAYDRGGHTST